jgi:uncharacterized protein YdeI (YjbR/CyaY-like superfamily)
VTKQKALTRALVPMPPDVRRLLVSRKLLAAYEARPAYQQNDYLGWMERAKLPATRQKRLEQMLEELERGGVYMEMKWAPRGSSAARARKTRTAR